MIFYRNLLRFVQTAIILVVLPRVAEFVGRLGSNVPGFDMHDVIRYAFALTLGAGVIASAYFADETPAPEYDEEPTHAREAKRREREAAFYETQHQAAPYARRAVLAFAVMDGLFNLGDALMGANESGAFDLPEATAEALRLGAALNIGQAIEVGSVVLYAVLVFAFGLSPTILAIILSKTISMVNRIPEDYERPKRTRDIDWTRTVMAWLGLSEYREQKALPVSEPKKKRVGVKTANIHKKIRAGQEALGRMPTFSEVMNSLPDGYASKSTVSEAIRSYGE